MDNDDNDNDDDDDDDDNDDNDDDDDVMLLVLPVMLYNISPISQSNIATLQLLPVVIPIDLYRISSYRSRLTCIG